jgi:hypothetical protein
MELDRVVDVVMERLRDDRSLAGDPEGLLGLLADHPEHDPHEVAARAREIWKEEATSGRSADRAQGAALLANALYRALGDEERSLRAGYEFLEIRYALAGDPEAYGSVREQLARLFARASELGIADLGFEAAALAADCTFFALREVEEPDRQARTVDVLLDDLLSTCDALRRCSDCRERVPLSFERFVSLSAATCEAVEVTLSGLGSASALLPDGASREGLDARMRRLAAAVEELVPDGFRYALHGAPEKSATTAGTLSRLSQQYGSRERARERLLASLGDG